MIIKTIVVTEDTNLFEKIQQLVEGINIEVAITGELAEAVKLHRENGYRAIFIDIETIGITDAVSYMFKDVYPEVNPFVCLISDSKEERGHYYGNNVGFVSRINFQSDFYLWVKYLRTSIRPVTVNKERDFVIAELLSKLGFQTKLSGTMYIKLILLRMIELHMLFDNFEFEVYPYIARRFTTTVDAVERAIRVSIDSAYRSNTELFSSLYKEKPSIKELVLTIIDLLKDYPYVI